MQLDRETKKNGYRAAPKLGMNITITILDNILTITVGLPARVSTDSCPAFSGETPNDWLSPTDKILNTHGIGQCGAFSPFPC